MVLVKACWKGVEHDVATSPRVLVTTGTLGDVTMWTVQLLVYNWQHCNAKARQVGSLIRYMVVGLENQAWSR